MKYATLVLSFFISLSSVGQQDFAEDCGIGLTMVADPFLYDDMSIPTSLSRTRALEGDWVPEEYSPFFFKPDYGLYHFVCLEKTDTYYKVLVNESEIGYFPSNAEFVFRTWESTLMNAVVERITADNPLLSECDSESAIVEFNCETERFTVEDVLEKDGEYWLYVSFDPNCSVYPDASTPLEYGWIKWKENGVLLVNLMLLC